MPEDPLEAYLPTVREDARDTVRALAAAIDAELVTRYVREAVAKHPHRY